MDVNGSFETQYFDPATAIEVKIPSEPIIRDNHNLYNLRSLSGKPRKLYGPQDSTQKDARRQRATTKLQYRKALPDDEVQIQGAWHSPGVPNYGTFKTNKELEEGSRSADITNDWEDASGIFQPGREPNTENDYRAQSREGKRRAQYQ